MHVGMSSCAVAAPPCSLFLAGGAPALLSDFRGPPTPPLRSRHLGRRSAVTSGPTYLGDGGQQAGVEGIPREQHERLGAKALQLGGHARGAAHRLVPAGAGADVVAAGAQEREKTSCIARKYSCRDWWRPGLLEPSAREQGGTVPAAEHSSEAAGAGDQPAEVTATSDRTD